MEHKNAWLTYDEAALTALENVSARYKAFLDAGKTERECVKETIRLAEMKGYKNLQDKIDNAEEIKAGDKLYHQVMGKAIMLFIIGKAPMEKGINILGAHIDSPRMDVKQNPLSEEAGFAYFDTHYYGGIKKYQWVAMPLALHGVVCKRDGSMIDVNIGEKDEDPVFCVSDILPHLGADQMGKKLSEAITGEMLDVIIAGKPVKDEDKESVKDGVLKILKDQYGIDEEDFLSAEIEVVPAGKCRDMGFDRSMLIGYGHDDRVCAYAQLEALFDIDETPEKTVACILADKEEIGSVGATGMQATYFENALAEMMALHGEEGDLKLRRALTKSKMLSCDVSAGFDPNFAGAFEKKNSAFLGNGVCFNKFTGSRGKSGSNDANAEFLAQVFGVMDKGGVSFQTAELGKVDQGGGGTIAYICALYGMEVVDSGVAVLSMHAPWEVISKADLYEAYKGYKAFVLGV
ncbi:MAG: aminopeptidase [Clostridia bacterium]|nr:aminopeptidase [Clostridia bacterium]MBQ4158254.1 aminopeptidase [Clostridia bacterium]